MALTDEQQRIVDYEGKLLCGKAYAGSGKTFTLIQFAIKNADKKILYIVFNKAIREEAERKFPKNVHCITSHAMAFSRFKEYSDKTRMNISVKEYRDILEEDNWQVVKLAVTGVDNFMNSADRVITMEHIKKNVENENKIPATRFDTALRAAKRLWNGMIDINSDVPCTGNTLLKLFQLSNPALNTLYDIILFDEGQDANPVTLDIVLNNVCQKIIVGDDHQMINRWRGAENALTVVEEQGAEILRLTKSFRFGPMIAALANLVLSMKGEIHPLVGLGELDYVCEPHEIIENGFHAVISRTFMGVIQSAHIAIMMGKRVMWNGGIEKYNLDELLDIYSMKMMHFEQIKNKKILKDYGNWANYQDIAESTKDTNMNRAIRIIDEYIDIPGVIATMRNNEAKFESEADLIVTTAHTSKGLEWNNVILNDDFVSILEAIDSKKPKSIVIDEMNLIYVAITRAKDRLSINSSIMELIDEYYSRQERGESIVII
ncbi:3'-5' exonuclease [Xenorhabdus sp. KJ12.1]|uniref:3'-5' exonuclease n=1 Tax=Xenorhabdus sp. KJ12.1 TaxID=1851571 RepID=UPI000C05154D|nr:3'-5' exonuclease [Xenorhabdus sp. KJ12.1]PHM72413.1 DNA helicase [Xenorhabdus sp. KJ12.1]